MNDSDEEPPLDSDENSRSGNRANYGGSDANDPIVTPHSDQASFEAADSDQQQNRQTNNFNHYFRRTRVIVGGILTNAAAWSAFASVVMAVATIVYTIYAHNQWKVLSGQLTEMQGSGRQTDRLICLYQQQIIKLDASIGQASRLAAATENANTNILNADRPWIGSSVTLDQEIAVGNSPTAQLFFINSGRRPARITSVKVRTHLFLHFPKNPPYGAVKETADFLVPGAQMISNTKLFTPGTDDKVTLQMMEKLRGPETFFLYSAIEYVDPKTNISHYTHSCWRYVIDPKRTVRNGFYNCYAEDGYNDAD